MGRKINVVAAILGALTCATSQAHSLVGGQIDCASAPVCFVSNMRISGPISVETAREVAALLQAVKDGARSHSKSVGRFLVRLDSPGGSVSAAIQIGHMLRAEQLSVEVSAPRACMSACVLIFAGAVHRMLGDHGRLGLHRPFFEVPERDVPADRLRKEYLQGLERVRAYLKEMNVLERLADLMFSVEPENVRYLDRRSATAYGLLEWDPVDKEIADLADARRHGVTRAEFMDRRARALTACVVFEPRGNGSRARWLDCYQARLAEGHVLGTEPQIAVDPDFLRELVKAGTPVEPIDWSRYPFR